MVFFFQVAEVLRVCCIMSPRITFILVGFDLALHAFLI